MARERLIIDRRLLVGFARHDRIQQGMKVQPVFGAGIDRQGPDPPRLELNPQARQVGAEGRDELDDGLFRRRIDRAARGLAGAAGGVDRIDGQGLVLPQWRPRPRDAVAPAPACLRGTKVFAKSTSETGAAGGEQTVRVHSENAIDGGPPPRHSS